MFKTWQSQMDGRGFTEKELDSSLANSLGIHLPAEKDFTELRFNHQYLSEVLTESASIFSEVDVYTSALDLSMKLAIPSKVALKLAEDFLESEFIIELQTENKYDRHYTTHEMRKLEHELIRNAQSLKAARFISGLSISDIIAAQERADLTLSEEQQEAVLGVLGDSSFEIMSGSAGSGKSTTMRIVSEIYKGFGIDVWGAAIAKDAAKNLEEETGVRSFTIAKLLLDLDKGWSKVNRGDVVILDEAGQVGVKDMLKLQAHAIQKGFKIILTGEDKQLDAIQHGGVLSYLSRTDIIGTTRIETIRRQRKDWDKIAVACFRDGKAAEALHKYSQHSSPNSCA